MKEILDFLEREDLVKHRTWTHKPLDLPFELKSENFIQFAEESLKEISDRSLIGALSNIKRAIDCRIESLLYLFGMYEKAKKEDWSVPKKIDFLLKTGVAAPRILRKINKKRNEMEHEFKKPTKEEVEDFLDVANLFFLYTNPFFNKTYDSYFQWITEEGEYPFMNIELESKKGFFGLELVEDKGKYKKTKIKVDDEENY